MSKNIYSKRPVLKLINENNFHYWSSDKKLHCMNVYGMYSYNFKTLAKEKCEIFIYLGMQ